MGLSGNKKTMGDEIVMLQQQLKNLEVEVGDKTDLAPIVSRLYRNLAAVASEVSRNKKKHTIK